MKISVQTGGLEEHVGIDGAYRMVKEAGFDAVDVNLDHLMSYGEISRKEHSAVFDLEGEALLEAFKPWKDAAEKYGIDNYQAHAPFPSYVYDEENGQYNEYMLNVLKKTIIGCDYIGCHTLIIHPFFLGYDKKQDPAHEWDVNIYSYSQLIETAREHHVTICLENMFSGYRGKIYSACCSDITMACKYIDTLNEIAGEEIFGFCLDMGHLLLLGLDFKDAMIELGSRIKAFHVHDNNGINDQHLAPYMGVGDWDRFAEGLKAIHYQRTMSFETFNTLNVVDFALAPEALKLIAAAGRLFAKKAGL